MQFHHQDHLRLAWYITQHHDLASATDLITTGIRSFATHHGQATKYHETMTQFWIRLVAHLVKRRPDISDFATFLATFPQLLLKDLPYQHWRHETMQSPAARVAWVEPDLLALPV
jgi:hypothetical protein